MVKISQFKLNADACVNGRWVTHPAYPEFRVRVARETEQRRMRYMEKLRQRGITDNDDLMRAYVGGCLIQDVEGLYDDDGNDIVWSEEFGIEFLRRHQDIVPEGETDAERVYVHDPLVNLIWSQGADADAYLESALGN